MKDSKKSMDLLLQALQERAKELNCLYLVEEILSRPDEPLAGIGPRIVEALPPHWQYPDVCEAELTIEGESYRTPGFRTTPWIQHAEVLVQEAPIGRISVVYTKKMPPEQDGPFLEEETKLITTVAERLGHFINHQRMRALLQELDSARSESGENGPQEWRVALQMLKQADRALYFTVSRKMLNHLCWNGVGEAEELLQSLSPHAADRAEGEAAEDWNQSDGQAAREITPELIERVFSVAVRHFDPGTILNLIQKWMVEDKLSFLSRVVNRNLSLAEVADALRRYHHLSPDEFRMSDSHTIGITVSLVRRFLSDQLEYINVAKGFFDPHDFHDLLKNVIFSGESHGKLGGKSAGVCLAQRILEEKSAGQEVLKDVKVPKTWYITSDVVLDFMHFNNFGGVVEQKYKDLNQVRMEYPHIRQSFKAGHFPAEIINGLSAALDDFGDSPLIVRSSSLLEDRMGAAFSGKYKSLFLANQGSKRERLEALMMAIAEVYASTFGPDPIEYRVERGLIDFGEEMGIMLQEVVGTKIGPYFLPTFAGVAFSNNEFRWSPRIKRDDGLIRLVPGLGTRAVDRLSDDYPILIAPGQPGLRVNISPDEMVRYSPKNLDVINLETNSFETIDLESFFKKWGHKIPGFEHVVSVYSDGHLQAPMGLALGGEQGEYTATFAGLSGNTRFVEQVKSILDTLKETLGTPVDIEFASDGKDFYLLQCRPQSYSAEDKPAPIPRDLPQERIIFSANRYVTNGCLRNITHLVYVDPAGYAALSDNADLLRVGRAVGRLNKLLPKQQFVLIGPGRWGSRGDIKLGVNVTYSDINNTAAADRGGPQEGQLRARPLLRHPLLPGPGGGQHPLPAALPRRREHRVQRAVPAGGQQHPARAGAGVCRPGRGDPPDRRVGRGRRPSVQPADECRPGRGPRRAGGTEHPARGDQHHRSGAGTRTGGVLALAAADGRADRRHHRCRTVRRGGSLRLRQREERHRRPGQRHRPAGARQGGPGAARGAGTLARGLEPLSRRAELPAHRLPLGGPPRRALRHRSGRGEEDQLCLKDRRGDRCCAAVSYQRIGTVTPW